MKSGLLWYNVAGASLLDAIVAATKRYQAKFGVSPDTCFVNPEDYAPVALEGVEVKPLRTVIKGHLWVGRANESLRVPLEEI